MTTDKSQKRPRVTVEELACRQAVRPIESLDEMACDVFASDEELDEFLAYTYANRRDLPDLTPEDVAEALRYAAETVRERQLLLRSSA